MKKTTLTILSTAFLLGGCASSGIQTLNTTDSRACAKNFTYSGSFLSGRTYKSHTFIKGVSKNTAMQRAARYTVNDGWSITNTDKNLGIISASQTVSYGQGKTVPLNISVESKNNGVNVSMSYATSGGVTSPLEAIKNHFCSTMEAVSGK
jgi:glutamine cyclotransferase